MNEINQHYNEYKQWLNDLKLRIRRSQIKAAVKVNVELLHLYWDLGQDIVTRQLESAWGSGFFEQLSRDLHNEFPHLKGFSVANLRFFSRLLPEPQSDLANEIIKDPYNFDLAFPNTSCRNFYPKIINPYCQV